MNPLEVKILRARQHCTLDFALFGWGRTSLLQDCHKMLSKHCFKELQDLTLVSGNPMATGCEGNSVLHCRLPDAIPPSARGCWMQLLWHSCMCIASTRYQKSMHIASGIQKLYAKHVPKKFLRGRAPGCLNKGETEVWTRRCRWGSWGSSLALDSLQLWCQRHPKFFWARKVLSG